MMSKLLIAAACALVVSADAQVSRETITQKMNSLTNAVTESATKLERHERASVTRERMAQWSNFIADVEEHIPELLQDTASVAGAKASSYEPIDFPAFVAAAPASTTATWNPFEPWLVQLKAYRTYMANYIDYQITWVIKLKCTFTGDCDVKTTVSAAAIGATSITVGSTAGLATGDKFSISSGSSFLEATSTTCYTIGTITGNALTFSPGLVAAVSNGDTLTKSAACGLSASPSPSPAAIR